MDQKQLITPWRNLATAVYKAPSDSRIYGTLDVDVTETMEYVQTQRKAGNKLTLTHMVTAAIARSLYEDIPDINCFIRRGKIIPRKHAEVFVTVALERGKDMTGVIIPQTEQLSATEIAKYLKEEVKLKRSGGESGPFSSKSTFAHIPWPFRRWVFLLVKWWIYDMGMGIPFLNLPSDPFGSILLSNIGVYGLATGLAALFPIGKVPAVIVMGAVEEKAVVRKGEIVIRSMLPLTGTFDHRIVDGSQSGVLASGIARRLRYPQQLDTPRPPTEEDKQD